VLSKMVLDASLLLAFNFKLSASICYDTTQVNGDAQRP